MNIITLTLLISCVFSQDADTSAVTTTTQSNGITMTETANMITTVMPLIYITDQVKKCTNVQNPTKYSDCQAAINDPSAQCCYLTVPGQVNLCSPAVTKYPALFKDAYQKQGYTIDCPILNDSKELYVDKIIGNVSAEDAQTIVDSTKSITGLASASIACSNIAKPNSYDSCSSAITSNLAKCCYVSGTNGSATVNSCTTVPNASQKVLNRLYSELGAKLDCSGFYFNASIWMMIIYLLMI
jgi:hypothetical protein